MIFRYNEITLLTKCSVNITLNNVQEELLTLTYETHLTRRLRITTREDTTSVGAARTSASVEHLFCEVGIAFSAKRKSSEANTVANLMFARENLP